MELKNVIEEKKEKDKIKEKEKNVKAKLKKLNTIFRNISEDRKIVVKDLIENVAFISVELEDLQSIIHQRGSVEKYQNGENQWGYKPSSAVQVYNATLKSYNTSLKLLLNELPVGEVKNSKDNLSDFLLGKK